MLSPPRRTPWLLLMGLMVSTAPMQSAPANPPTQAAPAKPDAAAEPAEQMSKVQLVMLKDGPATERRADDDPRQAQHLAQLEQLTRSGKALIVGPIESGGELRGLVVLDVATRAEAEQLLAEDPWLLAGQLVAEYRTWYVAKGRFRPLAGGFLDVEPLTFGLLVRPADAPELDDAERKSIQAGHMKNIEAMAATGDLAIAGPFVEDTPLRGVLVFRSVDQDKIRSLVANDPAVQRRRLALESYRWWVPKGLLP